jgi:hypothetical protein
MRTKAQKPEPKDGVRWLVMAVIVACGMIGYKLSLDARAAQDTPKVQKGSEQAQAEEEYVKPEPQFGVVTAILYCEDRPLAVIEEQTLAEGDTIHDVTIIDITNEKVEFEKFGARWQQSVQQPADRQWRKSAPRST